MTNTRTLIQRVITPWNEELSGRVKFAAMDAGFMADAILVALDEAGLTITAKEAK